MGWGSVRWEPKSTSVLRFLVPDAFHSEEYTDATGSFIRRRKRFSLTLYFTFFFFCSQTLQNQYQSGIEDPSFPSQIRDPTLITHLYRLGLFLDFLYCCFCYWTEGVHVCISKARKKATGTCSRERKGLFPRSSPHPETGELPWLPVASKRWEMGGVVGRESLLWRLRESGSWSGPESLVGARVGVADSCSWPWPWHQPGPHFIWFCCFLGLEVKHSWGLDVISGLKKLSLGSADLRLRSWDYLSLIRTSLSWGLHD